MSNDLFPYVYALVRAVRDDSLTGEQREFLIILLRSGYSAARPGTSGERYPGSPEPRSTRRWPGSRSEPSMPGLSMRCSRAPSSRQGARNPPPGWVVRYLIGGCQ